MIPGGEKPNICSRRHTSWDLLAKICGDENRNEVPPCAALAGGRASLAAPRRGELGPPRAPQIFPLSVELRVQSVICHCDKDGDYFVDTGKWESSVTRAFPKVRPAAPCSCSVTAAPCSCSVTACQRQTVLQDNSIIAAVKRMF